MAVRTKKNRVNPLNWKVPIVSKDGTPTPEFMQKWTQQATTNAAVPDLTTAAALSALLDTLGFAQGDILYRDATLWSVLAPGTLGYILKAGGAAANPAWESVSAALDGIGAAQGDILYRNATVWTVLAPGTDGQLLSYDATAHAPKWSSIAGVLLGSGAPASVQPAGTLYSRTDTAAVYSSQPIPQAPVIVQSGKYDGNGGAHNNGVVFGSPVTAGNLLVAVFTDASITVPTAGSGWTLRSSFVQAATEYLAIYTRTAQVTDGTTPPNVVTGGPGSFSLQGFWELSGTDWSQLDGAVVINGFSGAGSPATSVMGSFTPSIGTDAVLTAVVKFSTLGSAPTVGAPFSNDQSGAFFRVQEWIGHDLSPAAGTPIAATITWNGGFSDGLYCVIGLKGTGLVANWVQVSAVGANPSATGGDVAVNGSAATFMRSDGAPAIQKTSSTVFGLAKVDNATITATAGVVAVANPVPGAVTNWTPTDASGAGLTLTVTTATYVQLGKLVVATLNITYPVTGSGLGAATAGLPVAASNYAIAVGLNSNSVSCIGRLSPSGTSIIWLSPTNTPITNAQFSGALVVMTLVYLA